MKLMIATVILLPILTVVGLTIGGLIANQVPWLEPPGLGQRLKLYLTTNTAHAHPEAERPELKTQLYPVTDTVLQAAIGQALAALQWPSTARTAHQTQAVITSRLWRFKDDLTITLIPAPSGCWLEITAQSRVGRGDLGANTHHIRQFLATLPQFLPK